MEMAKVQIAEIMERLEDVSISFEMEKMIEEGALTKSERVEARKEKRKLRKRRKKLEKEVEKELMGGEGKKEFNLQGKILFGFCSFLTMLSFFEFYITFK